MAGRPWSLLSPAVPRSSRWRRWPAPRATAASPRHASLCTSRRTSGCARRSAAPRSWRAAAAPATSSSTRRRSKVSRPRDPRVAGRSLQQSISRGQPGGQGAGAGDTVTGEAGELGGPGLGDGGSPGGGLRTPPRSLVAKDLWGPPPRVEAAGLSRGSPGPASITDPPSGPGQGLSSPGLSFSICKMKPQVAHLPSPAALDPWTL